MNDILLKLKRKLTFNGLIISIKLLISILFLILAIKFCRSKKQFVKEHEPVKISLSTDDIFRSFDEIEIQSIQHHFRNIITGFNCSFPATYILKISLDPPSRTNVFQYRKGSHILPRSANVIIQRGHHNPPIIEYYRLNLTNLNALRSKNLSTPITICPNCYIKRPINAPDDWTQLNLLLATKLKESGLATLIENVTCGLTYKLANETENGSYVTMQISANQEKDKLRTIWVEVILLFNESHISNCLKRPVKSMGCQRTIKIYTTISFLLDQENIFVENWKILESMAFYWRDDGDIFTAEFIESNKFQLFTNLQELMNSSKGSNCFEPSQAIGPLMNTYSGQVRNISRVSWGRWAFSLSWSDGTGPVVYDAWFSDLPVAFEISLQEIIVQGFDSQRDIHFDMMSSIFLSFLPINQRINLECPEPSQFFDQILFTLDGPRLFKNAFCIYEEKYIANGWRRSKGFDWNTNVLVVQSTIILSGIIFHIHFAFGEFGDFGVFIVTDTITMIPLFKIEENDILLKKNRKEALAKKINFSLINDWREMLQIMKLMISLKVDIDITEAENKFTIIHYKDARGREQFDGYSVCNKLNQAREIKAASSHRKNVQLDSWREDNHKWQSNYIWIGERNDSLQSSSSIFNSFQSQPHLIFSNLDSVHVRGNFADLVAWITLGKKIERPPGFTLGNEEVIFLYVGKLSLFPYKNCTFN